MLKRTLSLGALALALLATPAVSQDAGSGASGLAGDNPANPTLATVNGLEVTAADVAYAMETLAQALQRVPATERPRVALDLMIDMHLLAGAAQEAGLDDDEQLAQRVEAYRMQALRDLYMAQVIEEAVTEETLRARYEAEVGNAPPREEVSASHILVEDEAKARDLIEQLNEGADFATLAEANSADPGSAQRGGSLGFFGRGQMVPPFEEAAFALEEGEVTQEPVQSQFGFHIIKLDERRTAEPPAFEAVSDQLRQLLIRETFMGELARLKEAATIEYASPPEEPATAPPAQDAGEEPAATGAAEGEEPQSQ